MASESAPILRPRYAASVACAASSIDRQAERVERVEIAGLAGEVHGQDRLRAFGDGGRRGVRVDVQILFAHVDEHRPRARMDDHVRRRRPGDRRRDHLVPGTDAGGDQGEVHRRRPRGERDGVPGADVLGEAPLELLRARAGGEPAAPERLRDRLDLLLPDRGRLEGEERATPGLQPRHRRSGSVCAALRGRPGRGRRRGSRRGRARSRLGRPRGGAARSASRAGGRRPRRRLPRPSSASSRPSTRFEDALGRDEEADAGAAHRLRLGGISTGSPRAAAEREPVQVDAERGVAELGVVPAAEARGELHDARALGPEAELVYVGPSVTPERGGGRPRDLDGLPRPRARSARRGRARPRRPAASAVSRSVTVSGWNVPADREGVHGHLGPVDELLDQREPAPRLGNGQPRPHRPGRQGSSTRSGPSGPGGRRA